MVGAASLLGQRVGKRGWSWSPDGTAHAPVGRNWCLRVLGIACALTLVSVEQSMAAAINTTSVLKTAATATAYTNAWPKIGANMYRFATEGCA